MMLVFLNIDFEIVFPGSRTILYSRHNRAIIPFQRATKAWRIGRRFDTMRRLLTYLLLTFRETTAEHQ